MKKQIYSFQEKIVIREELVHRYVIALDNDDTNTLAEILTVSAHDPVLAKLIDEMEVAFAYA